MSSIPIISILPWDQANRGAFLHLIDLDRALDHQRISGLHWSATNLTLSYATPAPNGNSAALIKTLYPSTVLYSNLAPLAGNIAHRSFFATQQPLLLQEPYAGLDDEDCLYKNGALVTADERTPFDFEQVLPQRELDVGDVLTWDHVGVMSLAGMDTENTCGTFPPASRATATLEHGLLEQSGKARQSVAASSASSGRLRISREDEVSLWRWTAIFMLNGLMFVLV